MSNDSTRGSTSTCAGRSTGFRKTFVTRAPSGGLGVRLAFDLAAAFDAALDEVTRGEAHVGFERVDAGVVQAIAQVRHVAGNARGDLNDRRAVERAFIDRLLRCRAERACARGIVRANEELGRCRSSRTRKVPPSASRP